ncbi:MAG: T9SS type A sorting domain-containing protein [Flavobacteriia bacterium]
MKKIVLSISFLAITGFFSKATAQAGLEGIVVEKYYISDAADSIDAANNGAVHPLYVGSTTYRVYANLLPGYKLVNLYGDVTHPLNIETTTAFYNDPNYGFKLYQGTSVNNTKKNTTMIDSYLSMGGVANGLMGILKSEDTDGSIGNLQGILANTDALMGLPITGANSADGLMPGSPSVPGGLGFTNELDIFDQTAGSILTTTNGAIYVLGGVEGVTSSNHVLIGQFTTNGDFSFKINLQILTPLAGVTELYVADTPTGTELTDTSLTYNSNPNGGVGIEETVAESTLSIDYQVYPNPTSETFAIRQQGNMTHSNYDYSITDLSGKTVLAGHSNSQVTNVDATAIQTGIYLVTMTQDGIVSTSKLIKN